MQYLKWLSDGELPGWWKVMRWVPLGHGCWLSSAAVSGMSPSGWHVPDLGVLGERGGFSSDAALAVCWI